MRMRAKGLVHKTRAQPSGAAKQRGIDLLSIIAL